MAECVAHEGAWHHVVATHARVNVSEDLAPLRDGYAPLQYARRGVLVQLAVDEGERFGHPGDVPDLGPIRGKLSSIHPGDILVPPVLRAGGGGWLYVHGLGFVHVVPSSKESTNASFEGSSSMSSVPAGFEGAPEGTS
jgi:hypothetical protein